MNYTMKVEALFLFLILLLGLVLCSFLGGNCNNYEGFTQSGKTGVNGTGTGVFPNTLSSNTSNSNNSNYNSNSNTNINNSNTNTNGRQFDNYNHYNGSSTQLANGTTFTGPNGGTIVVNTASDGTQSLQVTTSSGGSPVTFNTTEPTTTTTESMTTYYGNNGTANKFYGTNGQTATVITADDGRQAIRLDSPTGSVTYTQSGSTVYNPNSSTYNNTNTTYYGSTGYAVPSAGYTTAYGGSVTYHGPNGGTVTMNTDGNNTLTVTDANGVTTIYTGAPSSTGYVSTYTGANGGTATVVTLDNGEKGIKVTDSNGNVVTYTTSTQNVNTYNYGYNNQTSSGAVTGPQGNTAAYATGPQGNTVYGTNANTSSYGTDYYSTLPTGIPASQIVPGQEDLYILKSQIVPPVCPAPIVLASSSYKDEAKCPACPACARCPEPAFDCKKVPNYSAVNNSYLPMPVLNDFSTFGM